MFIREFFLFCVNDYTRGYVYRIGEIYSTEYFCNTKVTELGEILQKYLAIW